MKALIYSKSLKIFIHITIQKCRNVHSVRHLQTLQLQHVLHSRDDVLGGNSVIF